MATSNKKLSAAQKDTLLKTLETRFGKNTSRHKGLNWDTVLQRLEAKPEALWNLMEMEATDGEPDVIGYDKKTGEITFCDCSAESPKGRRSICYDDEALEARKQNKPEDSAINMAESMGIKILNEEEYRDLQKLGSFDTKTSSWIETPAAIRKLGGALFCDKRYDHIFLYHNGADSYYAARGFRGLLKV